MAANLVRRPANRPENSVGGPSKTVCKFWLDGRCTKAYCRFLHADAPPSALNQGVSKQRVLVWTKEGTATGKGNPCNATQKSSNALNQGVSKQRAFVWTKEGTATGKEGTATGKGNLCNATQKSSNASKKSVDKVCKYWVDGNCVKDDRCTYLHKWFRGEEISILAKLQGHVKAVTGIALPQGYNKLFSASTDGEARVWDCHSGQCDNVINLGSEAGSLISEGPWVFVGVKNAVKAWNIQTNSEFNLDGPVGQVHAMVVDNDLLFAGTEEGVILVWKGGSGTNPFHPAAALKGHTGAVVCLTIGAEKLFSGSVDHTIRVWKLDTLQCVMTLNGHSGAVMSLICWDQYLLSCSLDCTIKVWAATEGDNLEVTYTHSEEHGVLALSGLAINPDTKDILLCSCNDDSVRLYELPSFAERGRLFAKEEVRTIEVGPGGLFFSGDAAGLLSVWKWMDDPGLKVESS